MSDEDILHRWTVDRAIFGDGRQLAYALSSRLRDAEEERDILREQLAVAAERAQAWRDLCDKYKELAAARAEKLGLVEPRGPCGFRNHATDCNCGGEGGDR